MKTFDPDIAHQKSRWRRDGELSRDTRLFSDRPELILVLRRQNTFRSKKTLIWVFEMCLGVRMTRSQSEPTRGESRSIFSMKEGDKYWISSPEFLFHWLWLLSLEGTLDRWGFLRLLQGKGPYPPPPRPPVEHIKSPPLSLSIFNFFFILSLHLFLIFISLSSLLCSRSISSFFTHTLLKINPKTATPYLNNFPPTTKSPFPNRNHGINDILWPPARIRTPLKSKGHSFNSNETWRTFQR